MKILMVCLGNICRSPMAEGVMKKLLLERGITGWEVDSAGIGNWHMGDPPDFRAIKTAKHHGIDISDQVARQIRSSDFEEFDHVLAMDIENLRDARKVTSIKNHLKIKLLLDYKYPDQGRSVPDPYFSTEGSGGFEKSYQLIYEGCEAFIRSWKNEAGR
ncbi:MAG: low molecular weight protein-tyrosine-phosphatase [Saprospiraceae bacterium]